AQCGIRAWAPDKSPSSSGQAPGSVKLTEHIETLAAKVEAHLQDKVRRVPSLPHELAYEVEPSALLEVCRTLRDAQELRFEMLMDLAGIDYLHYGRDEWQTSSATRTGFSRGRVAGGIPNPPASGSRFAVVIHLLSISNNQRIRLRARCESDEEPVVDSVVD